jgi:two-component system, NarL family, sensor histidine kinase DesK
MRKFRLFPSEHGIFPYVWLMYWSIPIFFILYYTPTPTQVWLGLSLIFAFLVVYRQSYWVRGILFVLCIALEILIIAALSILLGPSMLYMDFYPAVLIGLLPSIKQTIWGIAGLAAVFLGIVCWKIGFQSLFHQDWIGLIPALASIIFSPFAVRASRRRRELSEQLKQANQQIERLVKIEERQRIARDLHDTLGHTLSMITLKSELAEKLLNRDLERATREIRDIQHASRTALAQVRELVTDMRTIDFQEELESAKQILAAANIGLQVKGDLNLPVITSSLCSTILAMCLREAVTNIVRHSHATRCIIQLTASSESVDLTIQDNGVGYQVGDTCDPKPASSGNGLFGMRQRLELVNGSLTIQSEPKKGTVITISIPRIMAG